LTKEKAVSTGLKYPVDADEHCMVDLLENLKMAKLAQQFGKKYGKTKPRGDGQCIRYSFPGRVHKKMEVM